MRRLGRLSGITANPALGHAADLVVRNGGTAILSETPEIYGAEHMLLSRAASDDVGRKLLDLIAWWERYAAVHGDSLDNNPSPGNKAGGLTTILEKSLGAAAKGGSTELIDVLRYAETGIGTDGSFSFGHLAPGKYWLTTRIEIDDAQKKLRDNAERAKLRREAEAANAVVELQACQRLANYEVRLKK